MNILPIFPVGFRSKKKNSFFLGILMHSSKYYNAKFLNLIFSFATKNWFFPRLHPKIIFFLLDQQQNEWMCVIEDEWKRKNEWMSHFFSASFHRCHCFWEVLNWLISARGPKNFFSFPAKMFDSLGGGGSHLPLPLLCCYHRSLIRLLISPINKKWHF